MRHAIDGHILQSERNAKLSNKVDIDFHNSQAMLSHAVEP